MRLAWLLLFLALAVAAVLYFNPETARQLLQQLPNHDLTGKTDHLYQWKNAQGEWQVTDTPPADGIEYERQDYRSDLNVLPVPPGITPKP
jgi:predicted PurR-regulated permease PerM